MNSFEKTGYRFVSNWDDNEPKVGDSLNASFVWDGEEITKDQLPGTCAFETRDQVEEYAKYSTGWILKIGGDDAGYGHDMVGEILIANAVVIDRDKLD